MTPLANVNCTASPVNAKRAYRFCIAAERRNNDNVWSFSISLAQLLTLQESLNVCALKLLGYLCTPNRI